MGKKISLTKKGKLRVRGSISARHAWLDDLAALMTNQEKEEILPGLLHLNQSTRQLYGGNGANQDQITEAASAAHVEQGNHNPLLEQKDKRAKLNNSKFEIQLV